MYLWYVEYHGEEDDWYDVLEDPTKARALVIHRLQIKWKKCIQLTKQLRTVKRISLKVEVAEVKTPRCRGNMITTFMC